MSASLVSEGVANIAALVHDLDLQVQYLATDRLVAYGRKTRTHTKAHIELMVKVMAEFGCIVPVIVDEAAKVLAGNARVEAARTLGLDRVPTVKVSHLNDAQKRAFVIADNRLGELAGWDRDTLRIELEELRDLDLHFDLQLTGFSEPQIEGLLAGDADGKADAVPFAGAAPVSQAGDLWLMGDHRLSCGDATDPGVLTGVLGDDRVRTVFTDPPYNVRVSGHVTHNARHGEFVMASGEMSDEAFTAFLGQVWGNIAKALVPGGLAYLCMDWRHMGHTLSAMADKGLDLLNLIVWDKKIAGMGSFYRSRHELVFLVKKEGGPHTNRVKLGSNGRDRSNLWAYDGVNGFGAGKAKARDMHPTVKPMAMVRDALLDSSDRGEVVLDLFSGSGTTLIAAEVARRRGRAIELDPLYADTGVIRWQDFTGRQAVLAGSGETFAQVRARRAEALQQSNATAHGHAEFGQDVGTGVQPGTEEETGR